MDCQKTNSLHMANECRTSFSSIAQGFIQVGLDGVQEVGRVDVMFIQLTPARWQSVSLIWKPLRKSVAISQHGQNRQDKQAAASLGQAVDAAGQIFGHDAAFHRFDADLL